MSFWHAVLAGGIARRPLDWANRPLAGHATLKLPPHFFGAALFERVSAATQDHRRCDHEQDRHALHLLILRNKLTIARSRAIAECGMRIADQSPLGEDVQR
jgi:hypothetical protein